MAQQKKIIPYIQRNPRTMRWKGTHKVPQSNAQ